MRRVLTILILFLAAFFVAIHLFIRPSNDRDWSPDQSILPYAEFNGPYVTVHNIRNFRYQSTTQWTPAWYDKTFDLRQLDSAWFIVEPFGETHGVAHTFVSFGFADRDFLAVSVEIRKEKGETFSALRGLLRQYELMYVAGDERDLIALRALYRKDHVYLYPVKTTPERMRKMFVDMMRRANELRSKPEFYNTLTNNCTTNIVKQVNAVVPHRVPFSLAVLLPGYSDRYAYKLGLIDTTLPFEEARRRFEIPRIPVDDEYSVRIRERGFRRQASGVRPLRVRDDRAKRGACLKPDA